MTVKQCVAVNFAELHASPVVSIAWDCSSDISLHELGVLEVRYLNAQQNRAQQRIVDICKVRETTAVGEVNVIRAAVATAALEGKVISMTADGAAVNWGVHNGILQRLGLREDGVYCVPHQLQLTVPHAKKHVATVAAMTELLEGIG